MTGNQKLQQTVDPREWFDSCSTSIRWVHADAPRNIQNSVQQLIKKTSRVIDTRLCQILLPSRLKIR